MQDVNPRELLGLFIAVAASLVAIVYFFLHVAGVIGGGRSSRHRIRVH